MVLGNGNASEKSKKWVHPADSLVNGRVTYIIKFLGMAEVPEPRGMPMVKMALKKLSFTRHIKRTEGTKPPKVELGINIHSVSLSDAKTKEALHNIALHRVSYCAEDKGDKRLFAFIAKLDDNKHYCFGLDSLHQANDITVTIGQAFDLAYEKFLKENPPTKSTQKLTDMSKRIEELESENNKLRKRIAELEAASSKNGSATVTPGRAANVPVEPNPVLPSFNFDTKSMASRRQSSPGFTTVTTPETIDAFNMQPFVPKLPPPSSKSPIQNPNNQMPVNPFNSIQSPLKTSKDIMDMQDAFSKGLVTSEDNLTLDSFDPLKY